MIRVLAIDPGNTESGWCILHDYAPIAFGKNENHEVLGVMGRHIFDYDKVVIEMVASYGMAVGKTVFDTCRWIGRFEQRCAAFDFKDVDPCFVTRKEYVTELCGSARAKDSNVTQYLIDRFAPDTPNRGKGTKKNPGWFYGFASDVWQAYGLGVYYTDLCKKESEDG